MWRHIKPILQVIILATAMLVSSLHRVVLENTTKCPLTFYLVHTTIPNYIWVLRILAHMLTEVNEANLKFKHSLLFFFYTAPCKNETKQRGKIVRVGCIPRCANPRYWHHDITLVRMDLNDTFQAQKVYKKTPSVMITKRPTLRMIESLLVWCTLAICSFSRSFSCSIVSCSCSSVSKPQNHLYIRLSMDSGLGPSTVDIKLKKKSVTN